MEELELKKEKASLRKGWSNAFLNDLDRILEKCFLKPKNKKEHFITKDKLEIELIKLLQTQKKFTQKDSFKNSLVTQGMYDTVTSSAARIQKINLETKQVEGVTIHNNIIVRDFSDVMFFDIYSTECMFFFEKQKIVYDNYSFRDTFRFLTHTEPVTEKKRLDYYCVQQRQKNVIPVKQTDF